MSSRNNVDADQRPLEGADYPGPAARDKALRGTAALPRDRQPEGADRPAPADGGQRPADADGLPGGAAQGGVYADGPGIQPAAHSRRAAKLGRGVQGEKSLTSLLA